MAEEEMLFDPMMKKKKKKKVPLDLEDLDTKSPQVPQPETDTNKENENVDENEDTQNKKKEADIDLDLDDFSKMKKKKKKKKADILLDTNDADENKTEQAEEAAVDEDIDFSLARKKKKKPRGEAFSETEESKDKSNKDDAADGNAVEEDQDYTYDELLKRVFDIMRAKNPALAEGGKKKFVMKPPQVVRIGTKKTSFVNFADICRILHRQPKHLLAFLLAELGTSGSVDGGNQLIIKGRFQQKQIENVLRRYIKEYVTCHTCRSPDTILHKETRLFFLQCETCGSRCSVASIKSGFQALTGKRAAMKNKQ